MTLQQRLLPLLGKFVSRMLIPGHHPLVAYARPPSSVHRQLEASRTNFTKSKSNHSLFIYTGGALVLVVVPGVTMIYSLSVQGAQVQSNIPLWTALPFASQFRGYLLVHWVIWPGLGPPSLLTLLYSITRGGPSDKETTDLKSAAPHFYGPDPEHPQSLWLMEIEFFLVAD